MRRPVRRLGPDRIELRLGVDDLEVVTRLPGELREAVALDAGDAVARRLFPAAYSGAGVAEDNKEYDRLMRSDLVDGRVRAIETMQASFARGTRRRREWTVVLADEEAAAWLAVLNDVRLTLGVRLDIKEDLEHNVDPHDPKASGLYLLHYLGWLEEYLVRALSD